MPVTFENNNDIIVYALECVVAHATRTQQIFVAPCVWWLASSIGLEQELVSHIDKLQGISDMIRPQDERDTNKPQDERDTNKPQDERDTNKPQDERDTNNPQHERDTNKPQDEMNTTMLQDGRDCTQQYLRESKRLREIAALKVSGHTATGRINPLGRFEKSSRRARRIPKDVAINSKTEGINVKEISRTKAAGECLRCAWPSDRKGNHRVKDCKRKIKLDKGTALFPGNKDHQKLVESSDEEDPAESSNSKNNIDLDLRPYAPIVLSEVLLDRCCTLVTHIPHPVISFCMFCSLQYRLFRNPCFSFCVWYCCL